jgi:hypothetical protein
MVVAVLALSLALGGTAFAAATIGTSDIKDGAVTTPKLADDAVKAPKIYNGAVSAPKIRDGAVRTKKIADGHVRAPDLGIVTERSKSANIPPGLGQVIAECNAGERVISGGYGPTLGTNVVNRYSYRWGNGWIAGFRNNDTEPRSITASAYCLQG